MTDRTRAPTLNFFTTASSPRRLFLLTAPFIYLAYALLTPPFETPDEPQHLFRAWQLAAFELIGERRGEKAGGMLPVGLAAAVQKELGTLEPHTARAPHRRPIMTLLHVATTANERAKPTFLHFPGSVLYSPIGYGPQVLAVWIGQGTKLSVEAIIRLGRMMNACLAIGLIYAAMRLTPIGKLGMLWLGLFPMTAASCAAFGQDALVIGGACLLAASGLRVLSTGRWQAVDILITAVFGAVLTLAKIVYLPLAGVGAWPWRGGQVRWGAIAVPALICAGAALLTLAWVHAVAPLAVTLDPDIPPAADRLRLWLHQPWRPIVLLVRTCLEQGTTIVGTLFKFSWVDVGPVTTAAVPSLVALLVVLLVDDSEAGRLGRAARLWLLLVAFVILLAISFGLYFTYTPASLDYVRGIQARYLLPLAPFVIAALVRARRARIRAAALAVTLLSAIANLASLIAIARAFYSF